MSAAWRDSAQTEGAGETFIEVREMDLASLRSVRTGAKSLLSDLSRRTSSSSAPALTGASARAFQSIAPGRIDVLLLNAGIAKAKREFVVDEDAAEGGQTEDKLSDAEGRYEESACVNHVCEY